MQWQPTDQLSIGYSHRSESTRSSKATSSSPRRRSSRRAGRLPRHGGRVRGPAANDPRRALIPQLLVLGNGFVDSKISAPLTTPSVDILSVQYDISDSIRVMADAQFTDWSSLRSINIDYVNPFQPNTVEDFSWNDTEMYALGAEWDLSDAFTLRGGVTMDETPTHIETRTPRLPTTIACCIRSASPGTCRTPSAWMRRTSASRSTIRTSISVRRATRTWWARSTATRTCSAFRRSTSSKRTFSGTTFIATRKSPASAGLFCSPRRRRMDQSPSVSNEALPPAAVVLIGDGLLGGEARQVVRAAGLGAGAGQVLAAERLHADDRADLVAVDVAVADLDARGDLLDGLVDARMDAERQAVAGGVDRIDHVSSWSAFQRTTCSTGRRFPCAARRSNRSRTRAGEEAAVRGVRRRARLRRSCWLQRPCARHGP
jgi:hypothetical protein